MMKRLIVLLAALAQALAAFAYSPQIRDIRVGVTLHEDGSASISERWDVCAAEGTEWYLVRRNLADIEISGLSVSDETGLQYVNEGEWDIDRSIRQKAGRCGIVRKGDGAEICWGIGSLGDHVFDVSYRMSNCVKSLRDYDMLHMQLVSPGLSSRPAHVLVEVRSDKMPLDTGWVRAWGFGYEGSVEFRNGNVIFESDGEFRSESSIISLLRFDKGVFRSASVQDRDFAQALDIAMDGASFEDRKGKATFFGVLFIFLGGIALSISATVLAVKAKRRRILGMKVSEIGWCRDIPFSGDIAASSYVLKELGEDRKGSSLAGALILRMIYSGALSVGKDSRGRVEISFGDKGPDGLDGVSGGLYEMMLKASGKDRVLQHKEFSRWSSKHASEVHDWVQDASADGKAALAKGKYLAGKEFTESGSENARMLIGLRKFLLDFTLIKEKESLEAVTWRDYLVFGALLGIADTVAAQLKDINPQAFEQVMTYDYDTMTDVIITTRMLSSAITNASVAHAAGSDGAGGFGGGSSFGGGGGFSGGGFGGGSR